jgi:NAD(P)-dependent dehydrogenase (short-subunit alcohol dehydrogenase family)
MPAKSKSHCAIITGASKRIGKAIAVFLAGRGYDIALHYGSSENAARETAELIRATGRKCRLFQCDLNDSNAVRALTEQVFSAFSGCSLLINSASVFQRARFLDTDEELFDRHMNINLKAPFLLSQDFARKADSGMIVNILDTRITRINIEYFIYGLTKKALFSLTRAMAKELGPEIRVNGIAPGLILPSADQDPARFQAMGSRIPLKRTGNENNILSALAYLLDNTFITGECLFVDGGEQLI